jgi:hypothetical protein
MKHTETEWCKEIERFYQTTYLHRKIHKMPYHCTFDFLIDGWRIEFKWSKPHSEADASTMYWEFNLMRHGKLPEFCDFYIFCLADVPYSRRPVYLLNKSPLKVPSVRVSTTMLLNGESAKAQDFDKFMAGDYGIGPYLDPEAIKSNSGLVIRSHKKKVDIP